MKLITHITTIGAVLSIVTSFAFAAVGVDSNELREEVTVERLLEHLDEFKNIADLNGGNRVSGSVGYDESATYVKNQLLQAGYQVTVQSFDFPYFEELSLPILQRIFPDPLDYPAYSPDGFVTMFYSGRGDVVATVQAVDVIIPAAIVPNTSTSGCEASDFDDFESGNLALVQRGACSFLTKAQNAQNAGAAGVIIFNEGQEGRTEAILGTLQQPLVSIPVVSSSYMVGVDLYHEGVNEVEAHLYVEALSQIRTTSNVIGETTGGRDDRVVVVGAHLDSVSAGAGINDNGSGSAAILEVALKMAELNIEPYNQVRFAFWGAEEVGLVGSGYYVNNLSKRDIKNIALNLNFDMIASPNYVRFVYDGDGSETRLSGPNGSGNVEKVFVEYFNERNLLVEAIEFSGRSDYGPFIEAGIPAGGLFTGADGIKTEEQAQIYGGTASKPYDSYYHTSLDNLENISLEALDEMSDAVAHAVLTFAMTTSAVNGTGKASKVAIGSLKRKGDRFQK